MLVLHRKAGEAIMVGDIEVVIVEVRGDRVRVGIVAPKDIPVHRKEVYDAIQKIHEAHETNRQERTEQEGNNDQDR